MYGIYNLNDVGIVVTRDFPGTYVLSRDGTHADYIGRSDSNLKERLLKHKNNGYYRYVWFDYAVSPKEAYEVECEWYHRYGPLNNVFHPGVPGSSHLICPICSFSHHKERDTDRMPVGERTRVELPIK